MAFLLNDIPGAEMAVNASSVTSSDGYRTIGVVERGHWVRRLAGFFGPGYLVAVGYIDPGNWATDLAGGSAFGYSLLWVIMLSNLMAILLQILSARLGIATGMDLAQACRAHYSTPACRVQWVLCEIAICATDLAEVIGTAIALNLLFHIPMMYGVLLTAVDVLLILWLQQRGFRYLEALVMALFAIIFICFAVNLCLVQPEWHEVMSGFIPTQTVITDPHMLYIAIGIIGATVMPHNLYLHSSVVQTRRFSNDVGGKRNAIRFATIDVVAALTCAFLVNAAILVTSSAVFHANGRTDIQEIQQAYHLISPLVGSGIAGMLFGLALLAAGQSSTLTATLSGQIVMEGYIRLKLAPWARRLLTRSLAIVPALLAIAYYGEAGIARLLVLSQVILSLHLPFAIIPLIHFTSSRRKMGPFVNPRWVTLAACAVTLLILSLNATLLLNAFGDM